MQRLVDARGDMAPHMLEIRAPAQLEDQLVLVIERVHRIDARMHLGQRDKPMRQVRREPGDGAVQGIARAGIVLRAHGLDARMGGLQGRLKVKGRHGVTGWLTSVW